MGTSSYAMLCSKYKYDLWETGASRVGFAFVESGPEAVGPSSSPYHDSRT
jgi:hypothetical protein